MAYQNVGTPRFYIDEVQYLNSVGFDYQAYMDKYLISNITTDEPFQDPEPIHGEVDYRRYFSPLTYPELFTLQPQIPTEIMFDDDNHDASATLTSAWKNFQIPLLPYNTQLKRYCAVLNHNFDEFFHHWEQNEGGQQGSLTMGLGYTSYFGMRDFTPEIWGEEILNYHPPTSLTRIQNSGCTIFSQDTMPSSTLWQGGDMKHRFIDIALNAIRRESRTSIGALSVGHIYDMPNSADLDLTMEIEFDGYDQLKTMGGSTLTNVRYTGSPWWYDIHGNKVDPWSVYDTDYRENIVFTKRNGRRNWSMKFSYVSDKDLFASNYMSNNYIQNPNDSSNDEYNDNGDLTTDRTSFEYTLDEDDSFIAQVLNKVGNGQRFIFQPDNTANNPSDFAICVLDQDSLSIKQVAYKVYDISLKIREVW